MTAHAGRRFDSVTRHSKPTVIRTRWGYYWGYCNKYNLIFLAIIKR